MIISGRLATRIGESTVEKTDVPQETERRFNPVGIRDRLLARRNPQG